MFRSRLQQVLCLTILLVVTGSSVATVTAYSPIVNPSPTPIPGTTVRIAEDIPLLSTPPEALDLLKNQTRHSIWLTVPRYSQTDSRWRNDIMRTCGSTIGNAGCLLTSASMVFASFGSSKNPGQVNSCMGTSACPWIFADGANNCSENHASWLGLYSPNYATFIWALSEGYPPIIELTKGGTHWVVIYAVDGSGLSDSDYYILDPLGGVYRRLSYYTGNGWSMNRLAIYNRR